MAERVGEGSAALLAVERSIDQARQRSLVRVRGMLDATAEIVRETGDLDFTVHEVARRAHVSLSTFYRHFPGRDDLLLALFEDIQEQAAAHLEKLVSVEERPVGRLRTCVTGLFTLTERTEPKYRAALVREHFRLAGSQPDELARAIEPCIGLLEREIDAAMAAGVVRPGDARSDAYSVFHLVLAHVQPLATAEGPIRDDVAERVWTFCFEGLAQRDSSTGVTA